MKYEQMNKVTNIILSICVIAQLVAVGFMTYNYFLLKSHFNCQNQGGFQIESFGDCLLLKENWEQPITNITK